MKKKEEKSGSAGDRTHDRGRVPLCCLTLYHCATGLTHQKLVKIYVIKLLYSNVTQEPSKLQSTTIYQNEALVKPIKNLASKHQMIFKTPQKRPPNPPTSSKKKSGNSLGFVLVP